MFKRIHFSTNIVEICGYLMTFAIFSAKYLLTFPKPNKKKKEKKKRDNNTSNRSITQFIVSFASLILARPPRVLAPLHLPPCASGWPGRFRARMFHGLTFQPNGRNFAPKPDGCFEVKRTRTWGSCFGYARFRLCQQQLQTFQEHWANRIVHHLSARWRVGENQMS